MLREIHTSRDRKAALMTHFKLNFSPASPPAPRDRLLPRELSQALLRAKGRFGLVLVSCLQVPTHFQDTDHSPRHLTASAFRLKQGRSLQNSSPCDGLSGTRVLPVLPSAAWLCGGNPESHPASSSRETFPGAGKTKRTTFGNTCRAFTPQCFKWMQFLYIYTFHIWGRRHLLFLIQREIITKERNAN